MIAGRFDLITIGTNSLYELPLPMHVFSRWFSPKWKQMKGIDDRFYICLIKMTFATQSMRSECVCTIKTEINDTQLVLNGGTHRMSIERKYRDLADTAESRTDLMSSSNRGHFAHNLSNCVMPSVRSNSQNTALVIHLPELIWSAAMAAAMANSEPQCHMPTVNTAITAE